MQIAATGRFSLLLIGPVGCGKTLLARRMHGLLPPMSAQERREVRRIHSTHSAPLTLGRPLRAGEILMTGALGPMVDFPAGANAVATIQGLGQVRITHEEN